MRSIRRTIEDWEEWVRPYVERKVFQRRKNQYDAGKTESCCYSVKSIPFKLMVERGVSKHIKWNVDGICIKCGTQFTASWSNMWLKKAFRGLEVCGKCSRKEQFTDEWRQHNSEAQKIAQGTPKARIKMSKILKSAWKRDSTIRVRISRSLKETYKDNEELRRKIGDASRRNWKRPEYQEKVTGHGYHHGWFISKRSRIYFASSWELMFLVWCDENKDVKEYKRNEDIIPYEKPNGGAACYHPDFDVIMLGKPAVVEVKGGRSELDLVERKRVAAEKFYRGKKDYIILYKEDLHRMGIMKSSRVVGKWISDLVIQGKVEEYGFGKKH